ncbi:MAG: mechanosensitive ion channel family protein, partial [Nanoarchaeota archaeon]|nr:mechanosensitive ion channel family protein [Nanoarchaeota archaeon]
LLILITFVLLAKLVLFIFVHYFKKIASKTKTNVDDLIFERTEKPIFLLILAYGLKIAVLNLGVNEIVTKIINSIMALVFVLVIIRIFDIIIEAWGMTFAKKTKTNVDDVLMPLFQKGIRVIFFVIAVMWILHTWEINITPYLAGAGIAGLVLGMALQDSLKNIIGGVTLLLDKTYKVGDKVKLESGEVGIIHDIGLRSTKLLTFDNEAVYIPNGYLANSRVLNYTRPNPKVRVTVNFGVEYGNNIEKVRKVVLSVINKMEGILEEPAPSVQFLEMGNFSLSFAARFWVEKWDKSWDKKLEATQNIYDALNKAKINIPFPTQTIYLKK